MKYISNCRFSSNYKLTFQKIFGA